jgi:PAS domain S-box-containing protein
VLILSALQYGLPIPDAAVAQAVAALREHGLSASDLYVEHLDLSRHGSPARRAALAQALGDKLASRPVGLVIVITQAALNFLAQEGSALAPPGLPVLAAYAEAAQVSWRGTPRPVLSISDVADIAGTLRLGLELFPRTRRLVLVAGVDDRAVPFYRDAAKVLGALPVALQVERTDDRSYEEMLQHLATLPPDALVLLGTYFNDRSGRSFVPAEVAAQVARRASVPVLGLYDEHVRQGLAGGSVLQATAVGRSAGEIGHGLLTGSRRVTAPVTVATVAPQPMFDWAQLERWGADPSRLPDGTLFLNRPRTLWTDHREAVITAVAAILALSGLAAALAVQVRRRVRIDEERQRAERVVHAETQFSTTMLDSMPGAVYFYDLSGRFLRWNRNFEVVTGYGADEIAAMHPLDFFDPTERDMVAQRIAAVFAEGEASVEARFRSKSGLLTPYFFTGRQVVFDGRPCLVGVGIDISDRKRAETALRDSESLLREAQRIAGIGSWALDIVSDRVTGSAQTWVICEREGSDRAVRWDDVLDLVHADDRERLDAAKRDLVDGGLPMDLQLRLALASGHEKIVHVLGDAHRDPQGRPVELTGTLHDITARVRLDAEFRRRERAEAADRIKSAFLATMSHELRTPLNSIIGFTGILLQGLAGPLNPEQHTQLGMVRSSARHLLALVNDVLDISKIEAGQLELSAVPFDVGRAIEKVVGSIQPQVAARGLSLRVDIAPDLGELAGDERRFQQILLNLLSNAVKFTERGEVALRARRSESPRKLTVQVRDTGIGIQASAIADLFQPFRQIDDGLARQHEGTGLGLAICQRLAGLMGGRIGVESTWGVGSTFTLELDMNGAHTP